MRKTKIHINENKQIDFGKGQINKILTQAEPGYYMLSIEEWKQARTNKQNAFMHVCFDKYSEYTGLTPEEAKDYLKKKFGINKLYKDPDTGEQVLLVRHTSEYNIEEGKVFIDRMLTHFEYDCGFIIDAETRKQYEVDYETGELQEVTP